MRKGLHAAVDFEDDIVHSRRFYDRSHLDAMMAYLASMGVSRVEWILDFTTILYGNYPLGFDVLRAAVEAAHRHRMQLFAVVKPFEGAMTWDNAWPLTLPAPAGVPVLQELRGLVPKVDPFVAAHPQWRMQREPGQWAGDQPVAALRLIKENDAPTEIQENELEILSSPTNNHFQRYTGPWVFREWTERRYLFPAYRNCRILALESLALPPDHRYLVIRCKTTRTPGDFTNELRQLVELVDAQGEVIPSTAGHLQPSAQQIKRNYDAHQVEYHAYARHPQVEPILRDRHAMAKHWADLRQFDDMTMDRALPWTLDAAGEVAVARGKPAYLIGALSPLYPEVRSHWLAQLTYCLDRGVDGVNIRQGSHNRTNEPWAYGFNEPILAETGGRADRAVARQQNGDAYTAFLREARRLVDRYGKTLAVHLETQILCPDERGAPDPLPPNTDWQWQTWVHEIADEVVCRGGFTLRPETRREILDRLTFQTKRAGKPFILQSNNKEVRFDGPHELLSDEMTFARNHPRIDGFQLYETASISHVDSSGLFKGSPEITGVVQRHWTPA